MIADDLAAFLVRREPIFHNPEVIWDELPSMRKSHRIFVKLAPQVVATNARL